MTVAEWIERERLRRVTPEQQEADVLTRRAICARINWLSGLDLARVAQTAGIEPTGVYAPKNTSEDAGRPYVTDDGLEVMGMADFVDTITDKIRAATGIDNPELGAAPKKDAAEWLDEATEVTPEQYQAWSDAAQFGTGFLRNCHGGSEAIKWRVVAKNEDGAGE